LKDQLAGFAEILRQQEHIAKTHNGVHPTMINQWKKALVEGASEILGKGNKRRQQAEAEVDEIYRQINCCNRNAMFSQFGK